MEENKKKKIVYVDMDNVLVDFRSGLSRVTNAIITEYDDDGTGKPHYDDIPNIFSLMDPMLGAIKAIQELNQHFDLGLRVKYTPKKSLNWSSVTIKALLYT